MKPHHILRILLALALFPALSALSATPAQKQSDVVYATAAGAPLKLDLSIPPGTGPFPALIYVHGGGWTKGDKTIEGESLWAPLENAGIARFSINYRLAPAHKYPASSDDVDTAIRWVKAHAADYNIDPARIILAGDSAGGHLTALAVTRCPDDATHVADPASTRVAAAIVFYGPTDMTGYMATNRTNTSPAPLTSTYFGITPDTPADKAKALLIEASPAAHVRPGLPPFLLLHGDADPLVPIAQTIAFDKLLRAANVPVEFITVPGAKHGMKKWDDLPTAAGYTDRVIAWLQKTLKMDAKN